MLCWEQPLLWWVQGIPDVQLRHESQSCGYNGNISGLFILSFPWFAPGTKKSALLSFKSAPSNFSDFPSRSPHFRFPFWGTAAPSLPLTAWLHERRTCYHRGIWCSLNLVSQQRQTDGKKTMEVIKLTKLPTGSLPAATLISHLSLQRFIHSVATDALSARSHS